MFVRLYEVVAEPVSMCGPEIMKCSKRLGCTWLLCISRDPWCS